MLARAEPSRCPCCRQELPTFEKYGVTIRGDIGAVARNGERAMLTPSLLIVFECLVDAYPKTIQNKEIGRALAADNDSNLVTVYVCKLRRLIAPLGMQIINTHGFGYRLDFEEGEGP